jgi:replication-associated recombination protein RarA
MNIKEGKMFLKKILKENHMPVLLWGSPGIGKSDIVNKSQKNLVGDLLTLGCHF